MEYNGATLSERIRLVRIDDDGARTCAAPRVQKKCSTAAARVSD
jgi:hypothetical protein